MRLAGLGLAALMFAPARVASAQDLGAAQAFVARLYAAYHGKGPDYLGRDARTTFAPSLLRLMRRDAAATPPGDVGALDGDPICDCQDSGGLRNVHVAVTGYAKGHAQATVRFQISAQWRTVKLDLVAVHGHWRVSDVRTADTPSLVTYLTRSLNGPHPKE
jgi:uncharacterized protein DUF3828